MFFNKTYLSGFLLFDFILFILKVFNEDNIAFDLSSVSLYSFSGIESITIPAPDWVYPLFLLIKTDLIVIAKSHDLLKEKYPIAPAYGPLLSGSISSIISIDLTFGAPVTVPAGNTALNASNMLFFLSNIPIT